MERRVLVIGGGDLGSGAARRLHIAGFRVLVTDVNPPACVRTTVSYASALILGAIAIEGIEGKRVDRPTAVWPSFIEVMEDPNEQACELFRPWALVDARMRKAPQPAIDLMRPPLRIGLGPGFVVGLSCHAAIETARGHDLGRVIRSGSPAANSGMPGPVLGFSRERVVCAPAGGKVVRRRQIGEMVRAGEILAEVDGHGVAATIDGLLRGLMWDKAVVRRGQKIADIDPRGTEVDCRTISDKSNAVAGGVLEALLCAWHEEGGTP